MLSILTAHTTPCPYKKEVMGVGKMSSHSQTTADSHLPQFPPEIRSEPIISSRSAFSTTMRNAVVAMPALGLGVLASPLLLAHHDTPALLVQKDAQYVVGRDAASDSPSILTNGDFETGTLAPWNFTQLGKPLGVVASLAPTENPQARPDDTTGGSWHLRLSTNWHRPLIGTTKATVEQALQTQDGLGYRLSWSMMGLGGSKVSVSTRGNSSAFAQDEKWLIPGGNTVGGWAPECQERLGIGGVGRRRPVA